MAAIKTEFLDACSAGDAERVKKYLELFCPDKQLCDKEKWSLLKVIFGNDYLELTKLLFPSQFDPNMIVECEEVDGFSEVRSAPAGMAVYFGKDGNHSSLAYLLDCGADISNKTYCFKDKKIPTCSVLEYVLNQNRVHTAKYLISRGATIEKGALMWACIHSWEHRDLLELVVENIESINEEGCYPLHWTLPDQRYVRHSIMSFVNDCSLLTNANGMRKQASSKLWADNYLDIVKYLLQCGANPNTTEPFTELTAGHMVSRGHKVELYRLLLAHGWDIHSEDRRGWTALHYAFMGNDLSVIKFLVGAGASMKSLAKGGNQPIHAMSDSDVKRMSFPINAREYSALMKYNSAKIEILKYMVCEGFDINVKAVRSGLNLAETMSGSLWFYRTLVWLLQQKIDIPFNGDFEELVNSLDDWDDYVELTDCFVLSGFQSTAFIEQHIINAILSNNMPEYEAAIHANPHTLSKIEFQDVRSKMNHIKEYIQKRIVRNRFTSAGKEIILCMRRSAINDFSLYEKALADSKNAPSLRQLTIYSVRSHLLQCGHKTSLFYIIHQMQLPRMMKKLLSLEYFVDYASKFNTDS